MCYDPSARPPIQPIAGGAESSGELTLSASDGNRFVAFAARAVHPGGAGIVILPDVRGLHPFYEELAVRFAENSVDALAMDYFGRTAGASRRGDDFDWQPHVAQTRAETTRRDVAASVAYLRSTDGGAVRSVFTVGFCFGGSASWLQAANGFDLAGTIGFYGRPLPAGREGWPAPIERVAEFACPILGLFGGADAAISADDVKAFEEALTAANVAHELVSYPGAPHSFFDRRQTEFAAESADAWRRVLDFIRRLTG